MIYFKALLQHLEILRKTRPSFKPRTSRIRSTNHYTKMFSSLLFHCTTVVLPILLQWHQFSYVHGFQIHSQQTATHTMYTTGVEVRSNSNWLKSFILAPKLLPPTISVPCSCGELVWNSPQVKVQI